LFGSIANITGKVTGKVTGIVPASIRSTMSEIVDTAKKTAKLYIDDEDTDNSKKFTTLQGCTVTAYAASLFQRVRLADGINF
jgi:hypothetical protein